MHSDSQLWICRFSDFGEDGIRQIQVPNTRFGIQTKSKGMARVELYRIINEVRPWSHDVGQEGAKH